MKITIELPDTTMCGFVNYVFVNENGCGLLMGAKSLDSDAINEARKETEGEG